MDLRPYMQPFTPRSRRRLVRTLVLAALLVAATLAARHLQAPGTDTVSGRPRLVDGDSFFIGAQEVRLSGIDAPEGRQTCHRDGRAWRCGEEAKRALGRLVGGGPIDCDVHSRDQHGRLLATCRSTAGRSLNADMVTQGFAVAFGAYEREEAEARAAKRGIWGSEFERPQEWRRHNPAGSRRQPGRTSA